jgi:phenylalanyl-tRNA synthetase beta chain
MAEIKVGRDEIGFIGAISPGILKKFGLEGEVFVADLDFEKILELAFEERIYTPPSLYPASVRDLAVLVPRETKVVEVLNKINTAGGRMVRDVDLFDIYEGEELPEGKKNFAFHIIYQSDKKTLTSKEIDRIHQKIIKALEENVEWEVRK